MDFGLSEEDRMVQSLARDFAERELAPGAAERDEASRPMADVFQKLGSLGLAGVPVPEEYGGAGGTTVQYALVVEEFARVCASTALSYAAHISLGLGSLSILGSDEQKTKYLTPGARGIYPVAFGLTEPGAGSDAAGTRTTAIRDGDAWVISGSKCFITNGESAGVAVITAVTDPKGGADGISAFIVPRGTPGFTARSTYDKMGMRASETSELFFDECRIPKDHLLGKPGDGFKIALETLDGGRIGIAAQALGIARGAMDHAVAYAKERIQFGQQIANFQAIQWKLADMATEVDAARLLVHRAAWMKDAGFKNYSKESAMAKLFASDVAVKVTVDALQVFGGYGYMRDYPIEKYMRDAKITQIYEGTNQIQREEISKILIGDHISGKDRP